MTVIGSSTQAEQISPHPGPCSRLETTNATMGSELDLGRIPLPNFVGLSSIMMVALMACASTELDGDKLSVGAEGG